MIKCSFCEHPLQCNHCGKPFRPRRGDTHVAVYQPDMEVNCPECQHKLICKACGFVYGGEEEDDAD
jgi:DNA-directed RNA polymerase subunit RPC12/RpoP